MKIIYKIIVCIFVTTPLAYGMEDTKNQTEGPMLGLPDDMLVEIFMHAGLQEADRFGGLESTDFVSAAHKFQYFGKGIKNYALVCKQFATVHDQSLRNYIQKHNDELSLIWVYILDWVNGMGLELIPIITCYNIPPPEPDIRLRAGTLIAYNYTLLHSAAFRSTWHPEILSLIPPLIRSGIDINTQNYAGETALHLAAYADNCHHAFYPYHHTYLQNSLACIRLLLNLGADPHITAKYRKTPGDYAHSDEVKRLLTTSPLINLLPEMWQETMQWMDDGSLMGHIKNLARLRTTNRLFYNLCTVEQMGMALKQSRYSQQEELNNCLFKIVKQNYEDEFWFRTLQVAGANIYTENLSGFNLLHYAAWFGHINLARLLLEQQVDKNIFVEIDRFIPYPYANAEGVARIGGHHDLADMIEHWPDTTS